MFSVYLVEIFELKRGMNINHGRQNVYLAYSYKFPELKIPQLFHKLKEIRHDTYLQRHYHALHICFPFQALVYFPKSAIPTNTKQNHKCQFF